jgi:hypothetical protein
MASRDLKVHQVSLCLRMNLFQTKCWWKRRKRCWKWTETGQHLTLPFPNCVASSSLANLSELFHGLIRSYYLQGIGKIIWNIMYKVPNIGTDKYSLHNWSMQRTLEWEWDTDSRKPEKWLRITLEIKFKTCLCHLLVIWSSKLLILLNL